METVKPEYDVFLSYAREELPWVNEHLYRRLCRCRTKEGRPPRVFFDVSREGGIRAGENYVRALTEALTSSRKIVAVFSPLYFQKPWCRWELGIAFRRDPAGDLRILNPVLKEPLTEEPEHVALIQRVSPGATPDWFERLCEGLELASGTEEIVLEFLTQPADVPVNHTLAPIRVAVRGLAPGTDAAVTVTMALEDGSLHGTLAVAAKDGVAEFNDLAAAVPIACTRLLARTDGSEPVGSDAFRVTPPLSTAVGEPVRATALSLADGDEAVFFDGAIALIGRDSLRVSPRDDAATPTAQLPLKAPLRLVVPAGDVLLLADWGGCVHAVDAGGRHASWPLGSRASFAVPGGLARNGAEFYVGLWSGEILRFSWDTPPAVAFVHGAGVQTLAAGEGRVYVADFGGAIAVYRGGRMVNSAPAEPGVETLVVYPGHLLAVGAKRLYHVTLGTMRVVDDDPPLAGIAHAYGDCARPVLIDPHGKGMRIDQELNYCGLFHTASGAVPVSADDSGRFVCFRNPEGSRTLLAQRNGLEGRIVHNQEAGTLAVSRDGTLLAVGDGGRLRLVDPSAFGKDGL